MLNLDNFELPNCGEVFYEENWRDKITPLEMFVVIYQPLGIRGKVWRRNITKAIKTAIENSQEKAIVNEKPIQEFIDTWNENKHWSFMFKNVLEFAIKKYGGKRGK